MQCDFLLCLLGGGGEAVWGNARNIIRTDRQDVHRGGGTAIYYNTNIKARQRTDINAGLDIEATWLEVTFPNRSKTLICSTYCPDKGSYSSFKPALETMLERASVDGSEQLYLGDLNQDLLPKKLSADARDLRQILPPTSLLSSLKIQRESQLAQKHFLITFIPRTLIKSLHLESLSVR